MKASENYEISDTFNYFERALPLRAITIDDYLYHMWMLFPPEDLTSVYSRESFTMYDFIMRKLRYRTPSTSAFLYISGPRGRVVVPIFCDYLGSPVREQGLDGTIYYVPQPGVTNRVTNSHDTKSALERIYQTYHDEALKSMSPYEEYASSTLTKRYLEFQDEINDTLVSMVCAFMYDALHSDPTFKVLTTIVNDVAAEMERQGFPAL